MLKSSFAFTKVVSIRVITHLLTLTVKVHCQAFSQPRDLDYSTSTIYSNTFFNCLGVLFPYKHNGHETVERQPNESRAGKYGWLAIAGFVAAWDILAPETLTNAFNRARENPQTRPLAIGALAVTAAHLMGVLPREADPFYMLADGVDFAKNSIIKTQEPQL